MIPLSIAPHLVMFIGYAIPIPKILPTIQWTSYVSVLLQIWCQDPNKSMTFDYVILKSNDASNLRISHTAITDLVIFFLF